MSGKDKEKTNVHRLLDAAGIVYEELTYPHGGKEVPSGVQVAQMLGLDCEKVFKTLVTTGRSGQHYVFVIPVAEELDLKRQRQPWEKNP